MIKEKPKKINTLAIAIPTCCNNLEDIRVGYVLLAFAMQKPHNLVKKLEFFIWDEGPIQIMSDRQVRLIVDLLQHEGHIVNYLRRIPSKGVANARMQLLQEVGDRFQYILMVDDDLIVMPGSVDTLLQHAFEIRKFGFLQGSKIEVDTQRTYSNDINTLNRAQSGTDKKRIYFGDAAFLLINTTAMQHINWDIVTKFKEENLAGEDVAISLMIADKMPCYGVSAAKGYHLSLQTPRWKWEASSDALQVELLKGVVADETLRRALPHMTKYI